MARLRKIAIQQQALKTFIDAVMAQGQNKVETLQAETGEVWRRIGLECPDVDFVNVIWAPHPTEDKIVPLQAKFNTTLTG